MIVDREIHCSHTLLVIDALGYLPPLTDVASVLFHVVSQRCLNEERAS